MTVHLCGLEGKTRFDKIVLFISADDSTVALKNAISELEVLVAKVKGASCDETPAVFSPALNSDLNASRSFVEDRVVKKNGLELPDHMVDPISKMMYLTPLGRQQVGRFI